MLMGMVGRICPLLESYFSGDKIMSKQESGETRYLEYRLRREIEAMENMLHRQVDSPQVTKVEALLAKAKSNLRGVETQLMGINSHGGVLFRSTGDSISVNDVMLGASTTGIDVEVRLRMSQIPCGIVHLLCADRNPLVTYRVRALGRDFTRLRFVSHLEGYSAHAVDTVELLTEDYIEIHQLPTFFPDRLRDVNELTRASLHISIDDLDRKVERETTFPIWLLARTSAYNAVRDPSTGNWLDFTPYYAAWVTPNVSEVMQVLRRAVDLHPDKMMVGYQTDSEGVALQVRAIFDSLKAEQITYVNSVLCFGVSGNEYMQRVRLPRESLANKSANCIDGAVLMASLLEAASLNPALVLVPGHAFLAWETQDRSGNWDYLETTMISSQDFSTACEAGRDQAARWKQLHEETNDRYYFTLLSLANLRIEQAITPME